MKTKRASTKTDGIHFRIEKAQKNLIADKAAHEGLTVSEYLIRAGLSPSSLPSVEHEILMKQKIKLNEVHNHILASSKLSPEEKNKVIKELSKIEL